MFLAIKTLRATAASAASSTSSTAAQCKPKSVHLATSPVFSDSDDEDEAPHVPSSRIINDMPNVSPLPVESPNDMETDASSDDLFSMPTDDPDNNEVGWWYVVGPRKQVQLQSASALSGVTSSGGAAAAAAAVAAPARSITNSFATVQFLLNTRRDFQYIRCNSLAQAQVYSRRGWQESDELAQNSVAKRSLKRVMGCDVRSRLLLTDNSNVIQMADAKCITRCGGKTNVCPTDTSYVLKLIAELQSKRSEFLDANEVFLMQRICQEVEYDSSNSPANSTHMAIDPFMCYSTWLELRNFSLQNDNNSLPLRWVLHLNDTEFEISMLYYSLYKAADYAYNVTPLTSSEHKQYNQFSGNKNSSSSAQHGNGMLTAGSSGQKARARSYKSGNGSSAASLGLGIAQLRKNMLPPPTPTISQRVLYDPHKMQQIQSSMSAASLTVASAASSSTLQPQQQRHHQQQQQQQAVQVSRNMRTLMCYTRLDQRFQPLFRTLETYLPDMCFQLCSVEFPVKQNNKYMTLANSNNVSAPCVLSGLLFSAYIHRVMDLAVKNTRISICPTFVDADTDKAMLLLHQYGKVVASKHEEDTIQNYELASELDDGGWNLTTQIVVPVIFDMHDDNTHASSPTLNLTYRMQNSIPVVAIEYQEGMTKQQQRVIGIDTLFPADILSEMQPSETELHLWVFVFQQIEGQFQNEHVHINVCAASIHATLLYNKNMVRQSEMCSLYIELQSYLHRYTHLVWTSSAAPPHASDTPVDNAIAVVL